MVKMADKLNLDKLDFQIIQAMMDNADISYADLGKKLFVSAKTLKEYDEILQGHRFLRVHKSHMVNPRHIEGYDKAGLLHMSDGSTVEVARRRKEFLQQALAGKSG